MASLPTDFSNPATYVVNNPLTDDSKIVLGYAQGSVSTTVFKLVSATGTVGTNCFATSFPNGTNCVDILVYSGDIIYTTDGTTPVLGHADTGPVVPTGWLVSSTDLPPYDRIELDGPGIFNFKCLKADTDGATAQVEVRFCRKELTTRDFKA